MSVSVTVRVDTANMNALLRSSGGAVAADLVRRGRRVEARAKDLCPVNKQVGHGGGGLKASIRADATPQSDSKGLYVNIGSNLPYAAYVENGTPPRVIGPRVKKALWWEGILTPISNSRSRGPYAGTGLPLIPPFSKTVNHPGTRGRPFLKPALAAAV